MFDPEKVERTNLTFRIGAYFVDRPNYGGGEIVKASDYDQLLELYRAAQKEIEYLQDSCDPRYDTNQVG